MWTPLANAAAQSADVPPRRRRPRSPRACPATVAATPRAIVGAGSSSAPTAQANESSSRRRASTSPSGGRSSNRVDNANVARRSPSVSCMESSLGAVATWNPDTYDSKSKSQKAPLLAIRHARRSRSRETAGARRAFRSFRCSSRIRLDFQDGLLVLLHPPPWSEAPHQDLGGDPVEVGRSCTRRLRRSSVRSPGAGPNR